MEHAYYTPENPDSFSGASALRQQTAESGKTVAAFLQKQDAYTLHKDVRRKFRRRRTFTKGIDDLWQLDLIDLTSLSKSNDGNRYLLSCIDTFSKRGQMVPLKNKSASKVTSAFSSLIIESKPVFLQTDKGTEFLNSTFQKLLANNHIKHYTSENDDIKCAIVERWNRTMLNKIFRYLTYKNTSRYIDVLQDLVRSYNDTYHRTIKMSPNKVSIHNEQEILSRLFPLKPKRIAWKFEVGDTVRISETKRAFLKGYREKWTEEIFKVVKRFATDPPTYGLTDYEGEEIAGKFYAEELQKVKKEVFEIEKVIKTRKRGGKTEYFVKWIGYSDKFNSWVDYISLR